MARWRGSTTERGLGSAHVAGKKRLLAQMRDGQPCPRCGKPMFRTQALDRDHVIDRAKGGTDGMAVLSHASCNRSAGARAGNLRRPFRPPRQFGTGHETICKACGKPSWRAARFCEICGAHYHPSRGDQRSCSRACGVVLIKRNKIAAGWRPKPPPQRRSPRVPEPQFGRPVMVHYYTCRYCRTVGVWHGRSPREVCPARECQLRRLAANNLRVRKGMTAAQADVAVMVSTVGLGRW